MRSRRGHDEPGRAIFAAVRGDYAAIYQEHRRRVLAEREERHYATAFRASRWTDADLTDDVGPGWRRLVIALHRELLELDPPCKLYEVRQREGLLFVRASFTRHRRGDCRAVLARTIARATHTCEVCGDLGRIRDERGVMRTLCDGCWCADRALASERGERYANLTLLQLLSGDPRYPDPDEVVAFLDSERE
jgi:hypothetical protein